MGDLTLYHQAMVELQTRMREMVDGNESRMGNYYKNLWLKIISDVSEFAITNTAGTTFDPAGWKTESRYCTSTQINHTPNLPQWSSFSHIIPNVIPYPSLSLCNCTITGEYKVQVFVSIAPYYNHELTTSSASIQEWDYSPASVT